MSQLQQPMGEIAAIIQDACKLLGLTSDDIVSPSRLSELVDARHAIAWAASGLGKSEGTIGRALGNRDRSTINNSISRAEQKRAASQNFTEFTDWLFAQAVNRRADIMEGDKP